MRPIRYNDGKDLGPADMVINCKSYRPFPYQRKSDSPCYLPRITFTSLVFLSIAYVLELDVKYCFLSNFSLNSRYFLVMIEGCTPYTRYGK